MLERRPQKWRAHHEVCCQQEVDQVAVKELKNDEETKQHGAPDQRKSQRVLRAQVAGSNTVGGKGGGGGARWQVQLTAVVIAPSVGASVLFTDRQHPMYTAKAAVTMTFKLLLIGATSGSAAQKSRASCANGARTGSLGSGA